MDIGLDPNVHLGPLTLAWHGIFTAVGIFFGVGLPVRMLRGTVSEEDAYAIATWGVVGGIVGARLVHVADRFAYYLEHPEQVLFLWTGGIAVWGAVIGGVLSGYIVALRRGVPVPRTADAAAAGLGLGLAIGRIGDIINGEHHATACQPPLGICVTYSHPDTLGQGPAAPFVTAGPVHLAVAYDMVWILLAVGLVLWLWRERERGRALLPDGAAFWAFIFLYGLDRFVISFLRIDDPTAVFGLRQDQLIGILAMAAAVPSLARLVARREGGPAAGAAPLR